MAIHWFGIRIVFSLITLRLAVNLKLTFVLLQTFPFEDNIITLVNFLKSHFTWKKLINDCEQEHIYHWNEVP